MPIIGTSPESIDLAEDRERFRLVIERLGLKQPPNASATRYDEARRIAERIGYPVLVRPSFVLGGRAMEIVYDEPSLDRYMAEAVEASPEHPILIDKFLEDAIEVDVDAVCDGERTIIGGVMEHIEEAGIHSGDSACAIPPFSLPPEVVAQAQGADLRPGRGAEGPRSDEHSVRRQGWRNLRSGGQSAGVADGAVRVEGHRAEPGAGGRAGHGRQDARRTGDHRRSRSRAMSR